MAYQESSLQIQKESEKENDRATLPIVQDRTPKFGSLLSLDEWCSRSRQQEHKEDLSEDDRHL